MSTGGFTRMLLEAFAWSFAALLGLAVAAGCCAGLSRAFGQMGAALIRAGGRAVLVGVCVLAIACLLFAQKPGGPTSRAPDARAVEAPRRTASQAERSIVPADLPGLAARPSPFSGTDAGGFRFTGVELTPSSVVLGASWPLAERGVGETLDILGRARLDDGSWSPLAWTLPPATTPDFAVEVPAEILPGDVGTASFFALARTVDRDSDGDGLSDREETGWMETGVRMPDFDFSEGVVLFDGLDDSGAPEEVHVPLPFPVMLAGRVSVQTVVCENGVVAFVSRGAESESVPNWASNWDFSDADDAPYCASHAVVAPYWDDLSFHAGGVVRTSLLEVDETCWFAVEYADVTLDDMAWDEAPPRATFQVAVCEDDPWTVYVRYVSMPPAFDGSLAMVGAQGPGGVPNFPVAYHRLGSVTNGMTVAYHFGTGSDPSLHDTDGDGLGDAEERDLRTSAVSDDTDGDGLPDKWERDNGLDPLVADGPYGADGDPDGDGLANAGEFLHGTKPRCRDTDGDELPDGEETGGIVATNSPPWLAFDHAEDLTHVFLDDASASVSWTLPTPLVMQNHDVTNIVLGLAGVLLFPARDVADVAALPYLDAFRSTFPADGLLLAPYWNSGLHVVSSAASPTSIRVGTAAHAGEGFILVEYRNVYAALDDWRTNAASFQVAIPTNRADRAFVRYGAILGEEMDGGNAVVGLQGFDGCTLASYCDQRPGRLREGLSLQFLFGSGADPLVRDTDGDGLDDREEADAGTDPRRGDTDFDGMPDRWELENGLHPRDPLDAAMDMDVDDLSNLGEYLNGCDPGEADSDGDGASDGEEVAGSGNPCDPSDEGLPPPRDELRDTAFHLSGDYAAWTLHVQGMGPQDTRALAATMPKPGFIGITPHWDLRKGNSYRVSLSWLNCFGHEDDRFYSPWYCWGLQIDGLPCSWAFDDHSPSRLPDQAQTVVGEGWFADNPGGLLTSHVHMSEGNGEGVPGGGNVAGGLEAVLHVCKVESVRICSPDSPEWAELAPSRILLDDEPFRVQFEVVPEVPSLAVCRRMFGDALAVRTSGTAPGGTSLPLDDVYTTLSSSDGRTVVRVECPFGKLREIRALPRQDNDGVAEMAWIDMASGPGQSLADSEAFAGVGYADRGKAAAEYSADLEVEHHSVPSDSYFQSAGREILSVSYAGCVSASVQAMNQSDMFYYSGHGSHATGGLQGGFTPDRVRGKWNRDLDCVVIAGCAVLDVRNYRFRSQSIWYRIKNRRFSGIYPGEKWELVGVPCLLGYALKAPLDSNGGTEIARRFAEQIVSGHGVIEAWRLANDCPQGRNACVIDCSSIPHEFWFWDETSGSPVWTRKIKEGDSWR